MLNLTLTVIFGVMTIIFGVISVFSFRSARVSARLLLKERAAYEKREKLLKNYESFLIECTTYIFASEKIKSAKNALDIQSEIKQIVENLSKKNFDEERPLLPENPITNVLLQKPFGQFTCTICNAQHTPLSDGGCRNCGLPCPFWLMPIFDRLRNPNFPAAP